MEYAIVLEFDMMCSGSRVSSIHSRFNSSLPPSHERIARAAAAAAGVGGTEESDEEAATQARREERERKRAQATGYE